MLTLVAGDEFDGPFDGLDVDAFTARADEWLWEAQLADDADLWVPTLAPCPHPPTHLALLDDALPVGDPDQVMVCGRCGAEHTEGRWAA
ncbi:MAG TPA: hypothetical protein VIP77_16605 [Jiangellaceae bacterium]